MTLSGKAYVCSAGESFDAVALACYGDERYAAEILNVNPELCSVMVFTGGEMVRLPLIETPVLGDSGQATQETAPWKG